MFVSQGVVFHEYIFPFEKKPNSREPLLHEVKGLNCINYFDEEDVQCLWPQIEQGNLSLEKITMEHTIGQCPILGIVDHPHLVCEQRHSIVGQEQPMEA